MAMRIRVFTKAAIYEARKEQHLRRGFRIEDERATPVNGLCSFIAVKDDPFLSLSIGLSPVDCP